MKSADKVAITEPKDKIALGLVSAEPVEWHLMYA